jgi:hypothetical protein
MTCRQKNPLSSACAPSAAACFVLAYIHANQGRSTVTLALKWDVIAVCAVFVFVGAVLLGAF